MIYPKISIVTPNYNKGRFLEETIKSVLGQEYPNLEYIIIDGGSTDNSLEIIKKYERNISYWISEPDEGMYDAIRKGFEHSSGDILAWINSDDMYFPKSLFVVAEIFYRNPRVKWLVGSSSHYNEKGYTVKVYNSRYFNRLDFLSHDYRWIQQESSFWRRDLYMKAGGLSSKYKLAGDFDLWMKFSRYTKMFVVNTLIAGFRHSEDQLSHNIDLYCKEVETIINNENLSKEDNRQLRLLMMNKKILNIFKRIKILNWQSLHFFLYRNYLEEQNNHYLNYNFRSNLFS